MSQGYTTYMVEANRKGSRRHLGVALGRVCIRARIPVADVATKFNVSRQSVYSWFKGESVPRPELTREIEKYISQVERKLG